MQTTRLKALVFLIFGLVALGGLGTDFSGWTSGWTSGGTVAVAQTNQPAVSSQAKPVGDFDQAAAIAKLNEQTKGKENEPAEKVFKNIQLLKGVPAGRITRIMEFGYSRSLGVNCTHCHVPEKWESEDKSTKQVARDMVAMMGQINGNLLKNIKNLKSATPTVNCTTCHRGQITPGLNMPLPSASPMVK